MMPFIKGQSGNPKGKQKGHICTISPSTLRQYKKDFMGEICEKYEEWAPKLVDKVIQMALEGNEKMITMLWDKFFDDNLLNKMPKRLSSRTAADIDESQGIVIEAAGKGEVDIGYALGLIKALAIKRDSIFVKELEAEVNEITAKKRLRDNNS